MLRSGPTTPQDYRERSGFGRRREREWGHGGTAAGSIRSTHSCASTSSGTTESRCAARRRTVVLGRGVSRSWVHKIPNWSHSTPPETGAHRRYKPPENEIKRKSVAREVARQPRDLTAEKLLAHSRLPLTWHNQRTVLGFV